ncbi:MAG: riboflavin biosynthesis protein RibF [Clostridia bacterium]|nr:riboflavin biosynthesis protein RibF [Clostridia bacterium]
MQILTLPAMAPAVSCPGGGVWVLGFFDGVHMGHQTLLAAARSMAEQTGGDVGVWTFDALPKAKHLLTDPGQRAKLLGEYGVRWLVTEAFENVSEMSGEAFFREILLKQLAPSAIVCGFNFRFGYHGGSSAADLIRWGREAGIRVHAEEPCLYNGRAVSSTWIRSLVAEGEMDTAAALLTRPYSITGTVEHGKALGRKLGFPTANLRLPVGKAAPARGIYTCTVRFTDAAGRMNTKMGVCNIGSRPTVNGDSSDVTVETWILDFSGDLYGRTLEIAFYQKIRDEKRFDSLMDLQDQVQRDGETVRAYFAGRNI